MRSRPDVILWVGLTALTAAAVAGLWYPIFRRGRAINAEIASLRAELAQPADSPERIDRLQSQKDQLERMGRGRTAEIPVDADVAGLMRSLSERLDALNLGHREITTGAPRAVEEATALPVSIMVDGPFDAIIKLLRDTESMPRLVRVQRLRLAQAADRGKRTAIAEGTLRADLVLDAFYGTRDADGSPSDAAKGGSK